MSNFFKMALKYLLVVFSIICFVRCENSNTNNTKQQLEGSSSPRKSREIESHVDLITCAMKYEVSCFVDAAEDYLEVIKRDLLAEADSEALQSTGRSDPESRPSHLANTLGRLTSEFTTMFQNGFSGLFKAGREAVNGDENEEESVANELRDTTTNNSNGEARGKKKKKKKLHSLLKLLAIGVLIYKKVSLILKLFHAALQFKFYLLALGGLLLQVVKFWLSLKKESHPTKVIYYEHAQHQHHYGHGEDDGHSIWARSFTNTDDFTATDWENNTQLP